MKKGKGENDAELLIGVTLDGGQFQNDLQNLFSKANTSAINKKAGELGQGFVKNLLGGDATRLLNERITIIANSLRKLDSITKEATKLGGEGKSSKKVDEFLKPFERLTNGLSIGADKMASVRNHLSKEKDALTKVLDSIQSLSNNAPKSSRALDVFSNLPDARKLDASDRVIKRVGQQLAAEKKLLEDMRNMYKQARDAGLTGVAQEIAGRLPTQAARVKRYERGSDLLAAQTRVDKDIAAASKKAAEERLAQEQYQHNALAAARKKAADDRRKAAVKAVEDEKREVKKAQDKADQEAATHAKNILTHKQNFALGRSALEKRNYYSQKAATSLDKDPGFNYGRTLQQRGNKEELKAYNDELSKAIVWHTKLANFLQQEKVATEKLGLDSYKVTKELENQALALQRIGVEQGNVARVVASRLKDEQKSADLNKNFKATVEGNRLKNVKGDQAVAKQGGYTGFTPGKLKHAELKQAYQALTDMARAVETLRNGEAKLGNETKKLDERLRLVANSAYAAKTALDGMAKEHGLARFNSELMSTIKNFAKFAVVYQGLYAALGYVKSLAGAVYDLNKELANMQAITGDTKKAMEGVSVAILQTATNSRFTISELTEAAKVIAQAGKSAEELPKTLNAVNEFAEGTSTDLATAADIITSVGEVYKDLSDADIANQLTKAVNISKLNGEDLKTILSIGAQVGEGYNVTSEQMLAAASALRNAGIKASTVATGLRQAMVEVFNLQDNSAKALQEQYSKIGQDLSIEDIKAKFSNFKNEADPLLAVLRELKTLGFGAGGDFTLGRAFDVRAINVLKALSSNTQDYLKLQKEITFGQPAAEAAAKSMESLASQMTRLNNILKEMMASGAGGFFESLASSVKELNDFLEKRRLAEQKKIATQDTDTSAAPKLPVAERVMGVVNKAIAVNHPGLFPGESPLKTETSTGVVKVTPEEKSAAAMVTLAEATKQLDALQARIQAYDPNAEGEGSLKGFVDRYFQVFDSVTEKMAGAFKVKEEDFDVVAGLVEQFGKEADPAIRKELLDKLQQYSRDGAKLDEEQLKKFAADLEELKATSAASLENFKKFYDGLIDLAKGTDEAAKTAQAQLKLLHDPAHNEGTKQLLRPGGFGDTTQGNYTNVYGYQQTMADVSAVADKGAEQVITDHSKALLDSMEADIALAAATPNGGAEAAIEQVVRDYADRAANLGAGYTGPILQKLLESMQGSLAAAFSPGGFGANALQANPGGGSVANVAKFIPGVTGYGGGGGVFPSQVNLVEAAQRKAAEDKVKADAAKKAQFDAEHTVAVPKESTKTFVPDATVGTRVRQIDLEIAQLQKFGDATNKVADLINQRGAIESAENQRAIQNAQENLRIIGSQRKNSDEYRKAEADLANLQLDQQTLEIQNKEDYLDNMQKNAVTEMGMYDQQKKTILAAGGSFDGLSELNSSYMSTQQKLITEMEDYMRNTLNMTEEEIQRYIESRPELKKGLLTDKDYNAVDKKQKASEKAAAAAVPTSATTGNPLMDAKARAGLGFTNAENAKFASDKSAAKQNEIAVLSANNQADAILAANADPALAEQINSNIETRTAAIRDLNLEIQDLSAELETFSSTAVSELASVFNEEGIRKFTTALEQSGNALKDWGDNIRDSLLTAWDSVGDAIASAVLDGENFVDSMKKIARDLAREVFTMTTKNMMNNLLLASMTGSYGGATQPGQAAAAAATGAAAPAAAGGGFLSSVTSALGIKAPAAATAGGLGTSVSSMTVTAGVVNVNGAAGGAPGAAASAFPGLVGNEKDGYLTAPEESVGPPAPEKSLFKTVEDKISSSMDSVMSSLESAFKGLDKGLGGMLSGIGNMASDLWNGAGDMASSAGKWISSAVGSMFASTGAIIPMKFAGGYVSRSGVIKGPGSGTSDSIRGSMYTKSGRAPIAVSSGESILTAKATSALGENTIRSLNAGTAKKFSTGGMVASQRSNADAANLKTQSPSVTVNPAAPQNIQMINTIDSDSVVQAGLSSPASVKTLMNVIKANKSAFKQVLT